MSVQEHAVFLDSVFMLLETDKQMLLELQGKMRHPS